MNATKQINVATDLDSLVAAPLYCAYGSDVADAFLLLTEEGDVYTDTLPSGGGTPASQWHGIVTRWELPAEISREALRTLLTSERVLGLLKAVHEGHSVKWDGQNFVGVLTDVSDEAYGALEDYIRCEYFEDPNERVAVWEVDAWLDQTPMCDLWRDGQTAIEAADAIESEAEANNIVIEGDVVDYLEKRREAEAAIAAEDDATAT